MRNETFHLVGGVLVILGAIGIGWVIHRSFVVGDLAITPPAAVGAVALSLVGIALGRYLENFFDPRSVLPEQPSAEEDSEEEFDPEVSPLGESDMEDYDRDEPQ